MVGDRTVVQSKSIGSNSKRVYCKSAAGSEWSCYKAAAVAADCCYSQLCWYSAWQRFELECCSV